MEIPKCDRFEVGKTRMPYFEIELNKIATLFKWKSEQIDIPYNMEIILRMNGSIGYCLSKKKWFFGSWTGIKDELNRFTTYVGRTLSSYPETFDIDRNDIIVCGNNALFRSDKDIIDFSARMKNETDVSIYYQLVNSRNIPMLAASTDKKKREIEEAFKNLRAGIPVVVTTDLISDVITLDITEKDAIQKMQYLSSFYEVIEKRNAMHFGVDIPLVDKKAQVNSDELDNFGDVTSLSFLAAYEARLNFVEEMKQAGIEIECIRNPIYADEPSAEETESEEAQEEAKEEEENQDQNSGEEEPKNEEESN